MSKAALKPQHGAATSGDPYVPDHGNGGYRIDRYELALRYQVPSNRLIGRAELSGVALHALSRLTLDLAKLQVNKVKVNGKPAARFSQSGNKLHISPAGTVALGAAIKIVIAYDGNPTPLAGRWGQLGWEELTDGVIVASQPTGAPTWFPCNDHPSNKASYRISVTTGSAYQVIANGVLTAKRRSAGQTTWTYEQPDPMATYLASVQIGRYDVLELTAGPVRTLAAIPAGQRTRFMADFRRQPEMLDLFGRLFGPYPFPEYTVVITDDPLEIPLEAQGMSIFGSNFLDGRRSRERLVAHELAHQWFGNSVTLDSWRHIWLHEGFACYSEWLWVEHSGGSTADGSARAARAALLLQPQDLLIGDPGPGRMFDSRVYLRGALAVHALRRELGDETFFALLREWVAENRHGTANTDDFLALVSRRGGDRQHLRQWLFEAALPA